jgi:hypothetical protein
MAMTGEPALAPVELAVAIPPFFAESCGYHGGSRHLAMRWIEESGELWFSDDGHVRRGIADPLTSLWRFTGGKAALAEYRRAVRENGTPPWFLLDREKRRLSVGTAADVWRVIEAQQPRSR